MHGKKLGGEGKEPQDRPFWWLLAEDRLAQLPMRFGFATAWDGQGNGWPGACLVRNRRISLLRPGRTPIHLARPGVLSGYTKLWFRFRGIAG
jgi:hypothetical protein